MHSPLPHPLLLLFAPTLSFSFFLPAADTQFPPVISRNDRICHGRNTLFETRTLNKHHTKNIYVTETHMHTVTKIVGTQVSRTVSADCMASTATALYYPKDVFLGIEMCSAVAESMFSDLPFGLQSPLVGGVVRDCLETLGKFAERYEDPVYLTVATPEIPASATGAPAAVTTRFTITSGILDATAAASKVKTVATNTAMVVTPTNINFDFLTPPVIPRYYHGLIFSPEFSIFRPQKLWFNYTAPSPPNAALAYFLEPERNATISAASYITRFDLVSLYIGCEIGQVCTITVKSYENAGDLVAKGTRELEINSETEFFTFVNFAGTDGFRGIHRAEFGVVNDNYTDERSSGLVMDDLTIVWNFY